MKTRRNGQGMVEYIIIVAVVALAAITIFGIFGDTIREKLGGAVKSISNTAAADNSTKSEDYLKALK